MSTFTLFYKLKNIKNIMYTAELTNFPPNSNPFNHDLFHMGTKLGTNCTIMYPNHKDEECKYLIIINTVTGERLRVALESEKDLKPSIVEQIVS